MKCAVYSALLASVLTVVGCASNATKSASAAADRAMTCPKCETVWTTTPVQQGTKFTRYTREGKMVCPTCDKAAKEALTDGKPHNCPDCKVTLAPMGSDTAAK